MFKEKVVDSYPRPSNNENLVLVGYGCDDSDCSWRIDDTEFWKAIRAFGQHNREEHGQTTYVKMTYLYTEPV